MWPEYAGVMLLALVLCACSGKPETGPEEVTWSRDACDRCRMLVSEPDFAAQVRYFTENSKSKVATFDDIGCAVVWLQESPWSKDERTEIWVVDHRSKEWINARTATFIPDRKTPMNYGLGVQSDPVEGGLNFAQALKHVNKTENQNQLHRMQLELSKKQQELAQENNQ
ncbi:MAG: hypothetical protein GY820_45210 [Gammaproteobacteria bacterium]|nr:hypothetical protein [Gammaproteobacteria bacterium]